MVAAQIGPAQHATPQCLRTRANPNPMLLGPACRGDAVAAAVLTSSPAACAAVLSKSVLLIGKNRVQADAAIMLPSPACWGGAGAAVAPTGPAPHAPAQYPCSSPWTPSAETRCQMCGAQSSQTGNAVERGQQKRGCWPCQCPHLHQPHKRRHPHQILCPPASDVGQGLPFAAACVHLWPPSYLQPWPASWFGWDHLWPQTGRMLA
mmetsp:Transcript_10306/g.28119  ORF Transcript_10306/g.28119 Transcript_10306/m.28119 type:complete len:206 (-) Transcript_10306:540-1157(-)